jgi:hypothetical protein
MRNFLSQQRQVSEICARHYVVCFVVCVNGDCMSLERSLCSERLLRLVVMVALVLLHLSQLAFLGIAVLGSHNRTSSDRGQSTAADTQDDAHGRCIERCIAGLLHNHTERGIMPR